MARDYCRTERFGAQFRRVLFAANTTLHLPVRSAFVLQPQACSVPVLHAANSVPVENVFSGCGVNHQLKVSLRIQRSHIIDAIPFDSDAPTAAAYTSASSLFLALIFCLRMMCFQHAIADHHVTPALEEFRVSLSPAQSVSEYVVPSGCHLTMTEDVFLLPFSFQTPDKPLCEECRHPHWTQFIHNEYDDSSNLIEKQAPGKL